MATMGYAMAILAGGPELLIFRHFNVAQFLLSLSKTTAIKTCPLLSLSLTQNLFSHINSTRVTSLFYKEKVEKHRPYSATNLSAFFSLTFSFSSSHSLSSFVVGVNCKAQRAGFDSDIIDTNHLSPCQACFPSLSMAATNKLPFSRLLPTNFPPP